MRDVLVLCEGQTEREFVRTHAAPAVAGHGVALAGTLVGKTHRKQGGIRPWKVYDHELSRLAKERPDRHLAVLVDYYAMPADWPGRTQAADRPLAERGEWVERCVAQQADPVYRDRFVPCVQYHEFETLLFVDAWTTAWELDGVGAPRSSAAVEKQIKDAVAAAGGQAEYVNDHLETAPSKRIAAMIKGYDKVAWGNLVVDAVTLPRLREGCPWLNRWMSTLEGLGGATFSGLRCSCRWSRWPTTCGRLSPLVSVSATGTPSTRRRCIVRLARSGVAVGRTC